MRREEEIEKKLFVDIPKETGYIAFWTVRLKFDQNLKCHNYTCIQIVLRI